MGVLFKPENQAVTTQSNLPLLFIAGLLVGSSLFIKLQNLPVIFIVFCFACFHFLKSKEYKKLMLFILFCLLPVSGMVSIFLIKGSLFDFYSRYILTNLFYSANGLNFDFIDRELYERSRFKLHKIYPFLVILFFAFLLAVTNILKIKKVLSRPVFYFFLLIFIAAVYESFQPKTYLQHYYLLLFQPSIIFFLCLKEFHVKKIFIPLAILFQFLYLWFFRWEDKSMFIPYLTSEHTSYKKITSDITIKAELNNCDSNNILVWGWNSRYYVYGDFLPVIRDFVNVHLFIHEDFLERYYLHSFIADLQRNNTKRILVIDDLQRQKRFKLFKFPEFIDHYNLNKNFHEITMVEHNDQYDTYVLELF
jgi:hypothetical protein